MKLRPCVKLETNNWKTCRRKYDNYVENIEICAFLTSKMTILYHTKKSGSQWMFCISAFTCHDLIKMANCCQRILWSFHRKYSIAFSCSIYCDHIKFYTGWERSANSDLFSCMKMAFPIWPNIKLTFHFSALLSCYWWCDAQPSVDLEHKRKINTINTNIYFSCDNISNSDPCWSRSVRQTGVDSFAVSPFVNRESAKLCRFYPNTSFQTWHGGQLWSMNG